MTELRQLTGARGIAALAVVLFHLRLSVAGLPGWTVALLGKGYLAVDFFFLLSGFVIWLAWRERIAAGPWRFWWKRAARVWPLHALVLAGAAALAGALALAGRADPAFPWAQLPFHLLLVQDWGFDPLRWNDPAWSISAEAAAYLLFPLLMAVADWRRWPSAALVALAAAVLLALDLATGAPTLGTDIARFGVLRCLAEFTTGTIVAALYMRGGRSVAPLLLGAALLIAWSAGAPETLTVPAAFAALLLALACSPGSALAARAPHWLGEVSYALYLTHFLLWKAVRLALPTPLAPLWVAALYLAAVLALAHLLYHRFERPAQRWLEQLASRSSRAQSRDQRANEVSTAFDTNG